MLESDACTFCACTQYIRKKDTTNTSHSVSKMGGSRPLMKILNPSASSEQYQSRLEGRASPTHALATPTVKMPEGNSKMNAMSGEMRKMRYVL